MVILGEIDEIELFSENNWGTFISGWAFCEKIKKPLLVSLFLNDIFIRSQLANNEEDSGSIEIEGRKINSRFIFHVGNNLLGKLPLKSRIKISIDNEVLPFKNGVNNYLNGSSDDNGEKLISMLEGKFQIDHWGTLHRSFGKNPELKKKYTDFYSFWRYFFKEQENIDLYLTGGNLLGLVRENDFLDHDDDIDVAFCVEESSLEKVADVFFEIFDKISPKILFLGYKIKLMNVCHFQIVKSNGVVLDIFMSWITPDKKYYRYFGVGGDFGVDKLETKQIDYLGNYVLIPQFSEKEVALAYGNGWIEYDPYFVWEVSNDVKKIMRKLRDLGWSRLQERLQSNRYG